jgi:hypothetical protein
MTYGFIMDVPAPAEFYDALHAEIGRRSSGDVDGAILHVGRTTSTGFQIIEVWESKEQCDRFTAEVVGPAIAALSAGGPPAGEPTVQEFEPRGLVLPGVRVVA